MATKAASILLMIFEILVVLAVVFTTTSIAQAYGKSETVAKINAAEDMRMMLDTLVGVPGNVLVKYPHDLSSFTFLLRSGSISIFATGEPEQLWVTRTFFLPEGYAAETAGGVIEGRETKEICLEKTGKKLLLRACPPEMNIKEEPKP